MFALRDLEKRELLPISDSWREHNQVHRHPREEEAAPGVADRGQTPAPDGRAGPEVHQRGPGVHATLQDQPGVQTEGAEGPPVGGHGGSVLAPAHQPGQELNFKHGTPAVPLIPQQQTTTARPS